MSFIEPNKFLKGIRFRLTFVYSTLFGLFICVFAYIITNEYFQSGREDFDASLINYAIDLSEHLSIDQSGLNIAFKLPDSETRKNFPFILNQTFYTVRTIEGNILAKSYRSFPFQEIPYDPKLPLGYNYTHRLLSFKNDDKNYRAVNMKITNDYGKEMILQVAVYFDSILDREQNHLIVTFLIVPLLIVISSIFSFLIAGNALGPIKSLTDTANNIAAQNLSFRVPKVDTGDEVEELARTLNNLLERLEKSFEAQENFVSNASHQLNTPLAIIKGELDVLESKQRSPEEIKKFHQSLREELERLIDLVKNMLLVSRVQSGLESFIFHSLRLDELLLTTSSRLSTKARDKKIIIRFNIDETLTGHQLEVKGEKQLLDSLFENILDNAIKYSPEESTIHLDIKNVKGKMEVWIEDEGPGISEAYFEEMKNKRFKRGSDTIPGTGIGLDIAHKIAGVHGASIQYVKIGANGSRFIIAFPA